MPPHTYFHPVVFVIVLISTAHGISAASGKLGAVVAQVGFARLKDIGGKNKFVKHILEIFAFFMLTGIFSTLLLPETKGKSLEELSNENQEGFLQGVAPVEVRDGVIVEAEARERESRAV